MRPIAIIAAAMLSGCVGTLPPETPETHSYRASGNEPFWSVTIDNGRAVLERPDHAARSFLVGAPQSTGVGRRYAGEGIVIELEPRRCVDSMSGVARAEKVKVQMGNEQLTGCGGEKLAPETLNDTQWLVISLDGAAVNLDPPPSLEINSEGQVSGSDGCNRFNGGLAFGTGGKATASSNGASTLMACAPDQEKVARSYNALRAAVTGWRFEGDQLVLSTATGNTITLRQSI